VVEAEYRFAVDRALSLFVAALRIALTRKGGHNPYYRAGMEGNELGCFSPHFFISPCPYLVSTFELRARKRTISFNKKSATAVG